MTFGSFAKWFKQRNGVMRYSLHFALLYMAIAIFGPYIGVFYLEKGFSVFEIGILVSIGPFTALLIQPLWGLLSDRARSRKKILLLAVAGAAFSVLIYLLGSQHYHFIAITLLYTSFQMAIMPMSDAIAVNYAQEAGYKYAPIRMGGTLGYALAVVITGFFMNDRPVYLIFFLVCGMLIITAINIISLPEPKKISIAKKNKSDYLLLIKNKKLLFILIFAFVFQVGLSYHFSFISVFIKQMGYMNSAVGISMCVSALSEVPVLIFIERLTKRFGVFNILYFSCLMLGIRMLIFCFAPNLTLILLSQMLHGITYMSFIYCCITFIGGQFPKNMLSTGQSLLFFAQSGCGAIAGSMGGGYLSEQLGVRGTYLIFAGSLLTIAIVLITFRTPLKLWLNKETIKDVDNAE